MLYNYKQTKTNYHETIYSYRNHFRRNYFDQLSIMEFNLINNKLKQNKMYYRIYAKFAGQTKFQALDLSTGQQVINLIYATLIPSENLGKVQQIIEDNKDVKFEIRKAN